jgi:hypothetical protein
MYTYCGLKEKETSVPWLDGKQDKQMVLCKLMVARKKLRRRIEKNFR